jgi:hypothetical protein
MLSRLHVTYPCKKINLAIDSLPVGVHRLVKNEHLPGPSSHPVCSETLDILSLADGGWMKLPDES